MKFVKDNTTKQFTPIDYAKNTNDMQFLNDLLGVFNDSDDDKKL